jgi:hypothetical protein
MPRHAEDWRGLFYGALPARHNSPDAPHQRYAQCDQHIPRDAHGDQHRKQRSKEVEHSRRLGLCIAIGHQVKSPKGDRDTYPGGNDRNTASTLAKLWAKTVPALMTTTPVAP